MSLSEKDKEAISAFCVDEYNDFTIYTHLAKREKRDGFKQLLRKMAEQEFRHYEFWKSVSGHDCAYEMPKWKLTLVTLSRILFGLTFTVKLLERHEEQVIEAYKQFISKLPTH